MAILNYTTSIDCEKSISEIQKCLVKHGANKIVTDYENGSPSAVTFCLTINDRMVGYILPASYSGVLKAMKNDKKVPNSKCTNEQAKRVAWRIVKDWVEAVSPHFAKPMLPAGAVGLRVLSLFDGMSCGQQALERIGVNVLEYYASEIDKHAIAVTMHNYPNTKQLGSVIDVDGYKLPKIDLLIGGSPCQSFSFAGKRKGMSTKCETEILTLEHYLELKSEGYEFEGQSYLFWEYMRLLNEVKPKYFLLENVMMGEKWEKILSKAIGVKPIEINSALVSAQNRRRLYWTNIGMQPMGLFGDLESIIPQPKDKGILLKDILESEVDDKYYLSKQRIETMLKSERSVPYVDEETKKFNCLLAGYNKIPTDGHYVVHNTMPRSSTNGNGGTGHLNRTDGKTYCLDTGNTNAVEIQCVAMRGREAVLTPKRTEYGKAIRKDYEAGNIETQRKNIQQLEPRTAGKTNTLTSVQKDNLVMQLNPSTESGGKQPYQQNRIYDTDGISPALMAQMSCGTHAIKHERKIRRLTPLECERLQTVKDGYTSVASDSQRYRMLGNGWTVDVIAHILSYGEWS